MDYNLLRCYNIWWTFAYTSSKCKITFKYSSLFTTRVERTTTQYINKQIS